MNKLKMIVFKILKLSSRIVLWILSFIGIIILFCGFEYLIGVIQAKLFLPKEYIMWVVKYPFSYLIFIYEVYTILAFIYIFNKNLRGVVNFRKSFIKKHKIPFITFNLVVFYVLLYNVAVVTSNKIIDYTALSPLGKQYSYISSNKDFTFGHTAYQ